MNDSQSHQDKIDNLAYIKQVLQNANRTNGYPIIYLLWGCLVFVGYAIAEFKFEWLSTYWFVTAPLGILISAWLGIRRSRQYGQYDGQTGEQYLFHFALTVAFIFIAILTEQPHSILLLIGLSYALAGIYLERTMLAIAVLAGLLHIGISLDVFTSNLLIGTVFALGFFATAWGAAKINARVDQV